MVTLKIARFNPENPDAAGWQSFRVPCLPSDRLLNLLLYVKGYLDGTLTFRRSCAHGVCGSDAMRINGVNRLACKLLMKDLLPKDAADDKNAILAFVNGASTPSLRNAVPNNEDAVDAHLLADSMQSDPLMTLKLLRHVALLRRGRGLPGVDSGPDRCAQAEQVEQHHRSPVAPELQLAQPAEEPVADDGRGGQHQDVERGHVHLPSPAGG